MEPNIPHLWNDDRLMNVRAAGYAPGMTPDNTEQVAGGALGKVAGRIKETAGEALGRDDLAREGRLQHAGADAESEARQRDGVARDEEPEADSDSRRTESEPGWAPLHAEVDAERKEARIEA